MRYSKYFLIVFVTLLLLFLLKTRETDSSYSDGDNLINIINNENSIALNKLEELSNKWRFEIEKINFDNTMLLEVVPGKVVSYKNINNKNNKNYYRIIKSELFINDNIYEAKFYFDYENNFIDIKFDNKFYNDIIFVNIINNLKYNKLSYDLRIELGKKDKLEHNNSEVYLNYLNFVPKVKNPDLSDISNGLLVYFLKDNSIRNLIDKNLLISYKIIYSKKFNGNDIDYAESFLKFDSNLNEWKLLDLDLN